MEPGILEVGICYSIMELGYLEIGYGQFSKNKTEIIEIGLLEFNFENSII